MQYELLKYRGLQPNEDLPSMSLMYHYSKCKKEREEAAKAQAVPRTR